MQNLETDFLVVGSGIAGLTAALAASSYGEVLVIAKNQLDCCNSTLAQGGIAAAVGSEDSPEKHTEDTLLAGAGICKEEAVRILTGEAPAVIEYLLGLGAPFDRTSTGELALGREGAHSMARVVHRGDDTGAAIWETLFNQAIREKIHFLPETRAETLLVESGRCYGAIVSNSQGVIRVKSRAVILATGGVGQLFGQTTNSLLSTGEGLVLAWKAGATLSDLEFVQFHPTALATRENPLFLISEAVRGEGAVLVTEAHKRFMLDYHPLADLAPRDIVTRSIVCEQQKGHQVYLDASMLGSNFKVRFPNIYAKTLSIGIDPAKDLIPITPAAHFFMGGIQTDNCGRTNIQGLFACGECANTGVHGANRLASNSLLEGLVFGQRLGKVLAKMKEGPAGADSDSPNISGIPSVALDLNDPRVKKIQELMWSYVGIMRDEMGMLKAREELGRLKQQIAGHESELQNMLLAAELIASFALQRLESRGGHYRTDYPGTDPAWQLKHLNLRRNSA